MARAAEKKSNPVYFSSEPQRHRREVAPDCGRRRGIYSQAIFPEGFGAPREKSGGSTAAREIAESAGTAGSSAGAAGRNVDYGFDAVAGNGPEVLPVDDSAWRGKRRFIFCGGGMPGWGAGGAREGEAAVFEAVRWPEGEFEIDFNRAPTRDIISRTTTGLLMEALRLVDEGQRDGESEDAPVTEG